MSARPWRFGSSPRPALVGGYVYNKLTEALRSYAATAGFELYIRVDGQKCLSAHPYMLEANQAALKKRDEMKADGNEDEFKGLILPGLASHGGIRLLYHKGLIWSERHKTFISKVYFEGRPYGDLFGPEDGPEAAIEPSIVVEENHGVITILLVPVQPLDRDRQFFSTARQASVMRASRVLEREARERLFTRKAKSTDTDDEPGSPAAVKLGEFPVRAFAALVQLPDGAVSQREYDKAFDSLEQQHGLAPEKRDRDAYSHLDDFFTLQSEYMTFRFRSVE
jgi:hypothetical protein